jgi:hypothetical protein
MDKFNELTTGAKLVLGATVAFLIVSFFEWFEVSGELGDAVEAFAGDNGVSMWNGVGYIAGLLAIALIVWQALRLANIELELGITPAMITAALAALMLIFTFIRWIDAPSAFDRTIWAWLGLALAILVAVGAWMNMQASGESLADIRASVAGASASAKGAVDRTDDTARTTTDRVEDTPRTTTADTVEDAADSAAGTVDDVVPGDDPSRTP